MRRTLIAVVAVLVLGLLAWEFGRVKVWSGGFDLTVHVECPEGRPQSVRCEAFGHRTSAEESVAYFLPVQSRSWSAEADPFEGQPITVPVATSGRESASGWELARYQFRFLAVIAVLPDGRRVGKVVDIPDGRVSREVSVTLP